MKLKDTGLTAQDIKDKVKKYMIETYERFDFIAETAEGMYLYDENGTPYLDFYAGIAVNNAGSRNPKVVAAVKDQVDDIMHTFNYPYTIPQALLAEKVCKTIGMDKIAAYENELTAYAMKRLKSIEGMRIFGEAEHKSGVISFLVGNIHHLDMGTLLDRLGIAVRTGHHCAQPLMIRLGIEGTVRASFGLYNTKEEVEALAAGIERVSKMF